MKKLFNVFIAIFLMSGAFAQAPDKMTYQAVIRDGSGNLITNDNVGIRVSLLQGNSSGPVMYSETHNPLTNNNGLATFEIGGGTVISGSVATIDWGNGPYFIKTEIDPAGGTSYSIVSTHQLLSVPYALYAETAGNSSPVTFLYARKTSYQNISSGVGATVTGYAAPSSSGINFNTATGVATFTEQGIYIITAQISIGADNNPGRKLVWLNCTSSNWSTRIASNEADGIANRLTTSFVGQFNSNDQISIGVAQYTGSTFTCPNNTQPFDQVLFNIERIR